MKSQEHLRLAEQNEIPIPQWHKWGPYVSERAWGTVREDYSWNGDAWNFFPFDDAHQRVFRWGEDGIAGFCDRFQTLVLAPAFWNGKDPLLKERLFGLNSTQGNHGEDVKEYYYHLDATPTHSYMKYLYKYPQEAFPYKNLIDANAHRGGKEREFELFETGILNENRYFDIFIEYAKASPDDLCIKIEAINRGPEKAPLHIIPQLWFRNQWSWWDISLKEPVISNISKKYPTLYADDSALLSPASLSFDYHVGNHYLYGSEGGKPLFTNNANRSAQKGYFKDGFHRAIVHGEQTVNPKQRGTKACLHYFFDAIAPGGSAVLYLRFTSKLTDTPLDECAAIIAKRREEADEFYETIHPKQASAEERMIQRQALAGMIWGKQFYFFDVNQWIKGDNTTLVPPPSRINIRNKNWRHIHSMRILSMPDKWEYPWFAAWDLSFHCLALSLVDIEWAKEQLWLLLFDQFQHPNGAIPAYEWEFSDLNPPVQAWVALELYKKQQKEQGIEDTGFLKKCYLKLVMNFTYWVNKVDNSGCNVFEGGFLGLDNITLIDRSKEKVENGILKQSDGSGWMAMFSLNLMRMALELAKIDPTYEIMATKFFQHYAYIAHAMNKRDNKSYELWSDEDEFFYDAIVYPDGNFSRFKVRSLVGLIPLFAIEILTDEELDRFPSFKSTFLWFLKNKKLIADECTISFNQDGKSAYLLSVFNESRLDSILKYLWDPKEFRSDYGIRSLSKYHQEHPFHYKNGQVEYEPGEASDRMKGGNSNWRGPIWFPTNYLLLQTLKRYRTFYKKPVKVEGEPAVSLDEIIASFAERLISIFKKDASGRRVLCGENCSFARDPLFQNNLLFHEYFHAETGEGLGASHQTGWTGLVANLIDEFIPFPVKNFIIGDSESSRD